MRFYSFSTRQVVPEIGSNWDPAASDLLLLFVYMLVARHLQSCVHYRLVDQPTKEGHPDGSQEHPRILVGGGGRVDENVATWDHFRRVPVALSACYQ